MRKTSLVSLLCAGCALAACDAGGDAGAGNQAPADAGVTAQGSADDPAADGSAGVQASGRIDVDLPDRVEVEGVTVGPDGATVTVGDTNASVKTGRDPSVSVTTNRQ